MYSQGPTNDEVGRNQRCGLDGLGTKTARDEAQRRAGSEENAAIQEIDEEERVDGMQAVAYLDSKVTEQAKASFDRCVVDLRHLADQGPDA